MEDRIPSRKRPFSEHGDMESNSSAQKKVRFPKGKKIKPTEEVGVSGEIKNGSEWRTDPRLAATERLRRRSRMATEICIEENEGIIHDIGAAEVDYEDNENFYDDGIQIEPFNLEREREEGYFDAAGNFVEYIDTSEIKDAWLDNVDVHSRFSGKISESTDIDDDSNDLSSDEIGKIKRRIADILEPGETVLAALKRLKGNSKNKKEKMPPETKYLFDQLTEGAMKLMDNGDYNVYHESQEVFEREAEGYESLSRARRDVTSISGNGYAYGSQNMLPSTTASSITGSASLPNAPVGDVPSNYKAEAFDIFAEEDDVTDATEQPTYNADVLESINTVPQTLSAMSDEALETGTSQSDYVYDEVSGYYYSSSLGYYYDPSSNLYCYAASGKWYSYNEETGTYVDVSEGVSSNI